MVNSQEGVVQGQQTDVHNGVTSSHGSESDGGKDIYSVCENVYN